MEAAAVREPDALGVVLLNASADRVARPRSRRSVLAHELCHLLYDATERHVVTSVSRESDHGIATEQRANAFAPAFLAPRSELDSGLEPLALAQALVRDWGLSKEGAAWYTRSLRGLPPEHGPALTERLRGTTEPPLAEAVRGPAPPGTSSLVHGLVSDLASAAFEAGHVSESRLREIRELA